MSAITAAERRLAAQSTALEHSWRWIDPVESGVVALFVLLAFWVLGVDLYDAIARGGLWTGTDGIYMGDQLQYLAWIRDASRHLLVSDMFVLNPTPGDYLQPMVAISGGLVALGVAPWVALLAWKPIALVVVLVAIRTFVHHTVAGVGARRAALAVALFGGWIGMFVDMWLPYWTWGYPFALVALGAALLALLSYERARVGGRPPLAAAALGALAGWLHPWQGEVLLLILIGAEAAMWAFGRRSRPTSWLLVVGATALPLAYYAALGRFDPSWQLAQQADGAGYPIAPVLLWLAPLLVPALLAYRLRPASFSDAAVRIWPLAVLVSFELNENGLGSSPFHTFLGISVPLAVLAAQGVKAIPRSRGVARAALGVLAVLVLTVPVAVYQLSHTSWRVLPGAGQSNFYRPDDLQALEYVERQGGPGGVLSDGHIGVAVPGETGRRTYVGSPYWSQPDMSERSKLAAYLLLGWMKPRQARAFVLSTGARFVIVDCWSHRSLNRLLGPIIQSSRRFGCARVYTIERALAQAV